MNRIPLIKLSLSVLSAVLIFSGCKGDDLTRATSKRSSEPTIKRNATSTDDGVTTGQINEDSSLQMQADGSGINGSEVSFPAGILAIGSEVSLQQGVDIVSDTTGADLALDGDDSIEPASGALVVQSGNSIQSPSPFTIALPIDAGASLTGPEDDPHANIIVVYKIKNSEGDGYKMGTMLRKELNIENTRVTFETVFFGSYQLGRTKKTMTEQKKTIVSSPVMTKKEEELKLKDAPIGWTITGNLLKDRQISFQFNVSSIEIESCIAIIDADAQRPFDRIVKAEKSGQFSWNANIANAGAVFVAISCRGMIGMESGISPWQEFDIPKSETTATSGVVSTNTVTVPVTNTLNPLLGIAQ